METTLHNRKIMKAVNRILSSIPSMSALAIAASFLVFSPHTAADELPSDWIADFENSEIPKEEWMNSGTMPDFIATMKVVLPEAEKGSISARVYLAYLLQLIDAADKMEGAKNDMIEAGMFERATLMVVGRRLSEIKALSQSWEEPIVLGNNRTEAKLVVAAISQREAVSKQCWLKLYRCFDDSGKAHSSCKKIASHLLETKKC
jgi:hypothetical protein